MESFRSVNTTVAEASGDQQGETGLTRSMCIARRAVAMGCPYLEAMEETEVKELLFSSGEARLRLLHWFTGRLHPRLRELTTSVESSTALPTIPKLTSILADVGLCRREDYELVQGRTSVSKQVSFLEAFFDLLDITNQGEAGSPDVTVLPKMTSVQRKFEQCCNFIDNLCLQEDLSSIFPTSISLLPPALAKTTSSDFVASLTSRSKKRDINTSAHKASEKVAPPSLSELSSRAQELRSLVEDKQLELERLVQSHDYAPLNTSAVESCHKSLSVSLTTLSQLMTSFCHTYEVEIQPWTSRERPTFTGLGPMCKRIDTHKQQLDKLLQCIEVMERTLQRLDLLHPTDISQYHIGELLQSVQQTFKKCTEVI